MLLTRPFEGEIDSDTWWKNFGEAYNLATAETAAELEAPLIDVFSYFKGREALFRDESHFTRRGHELAADWIALGLEPVLAELGIPGPAPQVEPR